MIYPEYAVGVRARSRPPFSAFSFSVIAANFMPCTSFSPFNATTEKAGARSSHVRHPRILPDLRLVRKPCKQSLPPRLAYSVCLTQECDPLSQQSLKQYECNHMSLLFGKRRNPSGSLLRLELPSTTGPRTADRPPVVGWRRGTFFP